MTLRAVKDALTGVAWHDDSQVVDLIAVKRYVAIDEPPRAEIWVESVAGVAPLERAQPLFAGIRP